MRTIRVKRTLDVSAEKAFDIISDHEGYTRMPGVKKAKLVKPGATDRNGVGAVREIEVSGAWFQEEITAFERPKRLGYKIIKSKPPIDHEGGLVELTPNAAGGVDVVWSTTLHIRVPLVGGLITRLASKRLAAMFERGLAHVETLARNAAA
ncbi:MAG TPA: SRPBCC family protein [Kofleriaceae bacterium]|nr:SRPBCC family protein [Kofleriaceae bacterium]